MLTVIGEALVDEVVRIGQDPVPHVGGSPLNVAVGLARLGHPVQFLGRYGQDVYGGLVAEHLRRNSVLAPLPPDGLPTSVARANLHGDGSASYDFALDWELPQLTGPSGGSHPAGPDLLAATTLLHSGSIATMLDPGAQQVLVAVTAMHPRATISYDPNCRPSIIADPNYARGQAEKFVRLADVVKASDEDLAWLYPGIDPRDSARRWLGLAGADGPALVVVTMGGAGAWAVCADGEVWCPVPPVDVVDTVGAGDSFMAALLSALVDRGLDGAHRRPQLRALGTQALSHIIAQAAKAAAVTVSRAGANPPSRTEMQP